MTPRQRRLALVALVLAFALAAAFAVRDRRAGAPSDGAPARTDAAADRTPGGDAARPRAAGSKAQGPAASLPAPDAGSQGGAGGPVVLARATWGGGPDQLGRERPENGNPEAPMSFAVDPSGRLAVLDQVNGRLVRFGADGAVAGTTPLPVQAAQDLAFAKDGTAVVLDRLADRTAALVAPDGSLVGELALEGERLPEGGGTTGVFVDGDDVWVEREHEVVVKVGDVKGRADPARPEAPGRPTRDGRSWLSAGLVDAATGRVRVSAIDRESGEHRFTRELRFDRPLLALVLLDTDRSGTIYLGALTAAADPSRAADAPVILACLAAADGRPFARHDLAPNADADETFREFAVLDEGGVVYARRDEQGITFERYACR